MKTIISITLALAFVISCTASVIHHDEDMAAKTAIEFSKVAIVQHNIQNGYSLMSDNAKKTVSLEQYSQVFSQMHPSLYPLFLTAKEFEPMPGQKGMNIFLYGENGSERFFYRLTMEGTKETGYKVSGIYRGSGPYPPSKLRQTLKTAYTT